MFFIKLLFGIIAILMLNGCPEVRDNQEIEALFQQGYILYGNAFRNGPDESAILQMTEGIKKMEQASTWQANVWGCTESYRCKKNIERNKRNILSATAIRGLFNFQLKNYDSAIPDLEKISEYDPMFLVYLGELYIKKGDIAKAKEQLYRLEEREERKLSEQLSAIIKSETHE